MRSRLVGTALVALFAAGGAAQAETVLSNVGFDRPESVRYDAAHDRYLVANIGSPNAETANDGFISIVSPEGKVENGKWIAGGQNGVELNDPLGTMVHGDMLYVADIDRVRMFDLTTGAPKGDVVVDGAIRLNDLDVAADGTVYVTDSANDDNPGAIYKITADGAVSRLIAGEELKRPNGIALDRDGNIVAVSIGGADVMTISPEGEILKRVTLPTGRLDGLVILDDGSKIVTSQEGSQIFRIPTGGEAEAVVKDVPGPAAIGFDTERNRILVPTIRENTVRIFDLPA